MMKVTAPETRNEIVVRLQEIISSPIGTIDDEDSSDTCDFFCDDLPFAPPYDAMVGMVLTADEVASFRAFMTRINTACERRLTGVTGDEGVDELKAAAADVLQTMRRNDCDQDIR